MDHILRMVDEHAVILLQVRYAGRIRALDRVTLHGGAVDRVREHLLLLRGRARLRHVHREVDAGHERCNGGKLSYQWYRNTKKSTKGGKKIKKATKSSYSVPTKKKGTTYYYCVVTNTNKTARIKKASTTSKAAKVVVR